jgi:hypothetical protein
MIWKQFFSCFDSILKVGQSLWHFSILLNEIFINEFFDVQYYNKS